jgi:hypothetical protein
MTIDPKEQLPLSSECGDFNLTVACGMTQGPDVEPAMQTRACFRTHMRSQKWHVVDTTVTRPSRGTRMRIHKSVWRMRFLKAHLKRRFPGAEPTLRHDLQGG